MATHSSNLPGKPHGQRSLAGYSPWSRRELDTTDQLTTTTNGPQREGALLLTLEAKLYNRVVIVK